LVEEVEREDGRVDATRAAPILSTLFQIAAEVLMMQAELGSSVEGKAGLVVVGVVLPL
jgi:hypothetical protein